MAGATVGRKAKAKKILHDNLAEEVEKIDEQNEKQKKIAEVIEQMQDFTKSCESLQQKILVRNLIKQYAFVVISMDELSDIISQRDFVEEYKNGENQFGFKKSAYVDCYNDLTKTLAKLNSELIKTVPKGSINKDMLEAFNAKFDD